MDTCAGCGGRLSPDLEWCPRCYARIDPHARAPVPLHIRMVLPEDRGPDPVYSRWRGGTTTFGPVGRLAITATVAGATAGCWVVCGPPPPFGLGLGSSAWLAVIIIVPPVLRAAWRKDRVA